MTDTLRSIRLGPDTPEAMLVIVPGYGDRPEPFLDRISRFGLHERWSLIAVEPRSSGAQGPHWYEVDENGPDPIALASSIAAIDEFCRDALAESGLAEDRLVIAGFSQGGALALAHLLDPSTSCSPRAVAALAAYLPTREDDLIDLRRSQERPLLLAHGRDDETVETLRGRSAARALHRAGGLVSWYEVDGGHRFDEPLTTPLRSWLEALARGEHPTAPPI